MEQKQEDEREAMKCHWCKTEAPEGEELLGRLCLRCDKLLGDAFIESREAFLIGATFDMK